MNARRRQQQKDTDGGCVSKLNVFRRKASGPILGAHKSGEPVIFLQARNALLAVSVPTFPFDERTLATVDPAAQKHACTLCDHQFETRAEQTRSGDEALTVFRICKICSYTETSH